VYIAGSTGGEIRDCIIANNTTYGVRLYNNAAVTVLYTDCWGTAQIIPATLYPRGGRNYANPVGQSRCWRLPSAGGSPCDNTALTAG
jgi:hypothetical protein